MEHQDNFRAHRGWCSDCRAAAARRCWDEHAVLNAKAAERKLRELVPAGALQEAAAQLQALQCQGEEVLHALTVLSAPSWDLTVRAGDCQLNGTLTNAEDPLTKALWVLVATRAALKQSGAGSPAAVHAPPAAARPLAAALHAPPAAARPLAAALHAPPAAVRPPAAALLPPPAEAPLPREMDLDNLSQSLRGTRLKEKAAALQQAPGVVRMVDVHCHMDPDWSLQLLQRAAPTVVRLSLFNPREPHLRAVHAMPRLERLLVFGDAALAAQPPELGALPPGHGGLRWLCAHGLPRATLQCLLRAHGGTLQDLELQVGTRGQGVWPHSCVDLHLLLKQCGLRALSRLLLRRWGCSHVGCWKQRAAVREALALPGLQVLCKECDDVQVEDA